MFIPSNIDRGLSRGRRLVCKAPIDFDRGIYLEADNGNGDGGGADNGNGDGGGAGNGSGDANGGTKEVDPFEGLTPEQKTAMEAHIAKVAEEAVNKAKETTKTEIEAEIAARQAKEANDAKIAKAKADNDTAEVIRLQQQSLDELTKKIDADRVALNNRQAELDKKEIALKYKLPEGFHNRLVGTNKQEWEDDAKKLAKDLPKHKTGDAEGGNQGIPANVANQQKNAQKVVSKLVPKSF